MMNLKEYGRKWLWYVLKNFIKMLLEEPRKRTENLSRDNRSPGRDSKRGPSEYEAKVRATQL
jgi:hypothetical protein